LDVKFCISQVFYDPYIWIQGYDRKGNRRLELVTEGDTSYHKKNDVKLDRVTHYLQEQFVKLDSEAFILNSMYLSFIKII
jgi:hypothetical protein